MAAFILLLLVLFSCNHATVNSARMGGTAHNHRGFSLDIVHRDSPLSPLYDPSSTVAQRAKQALQRSISRSRHFASGFSSAELIYSPVKPAVGEYLMKLTIGTPPHVYWAILDTGSDLIWTQCRPCDSCTGRAASMFDPLHSSTYQNQGCSTSFCDSLPTEGKHCNDSVCGFHYVYGDQSFTDGSLASDTLWLDSGVHGSSKFPAVVFGCVHDEGGNVADSQVAGLIGLGGGPLSLVSQIGSSIDNKFSYCLVPYDAKTSIGQLKFGSGADFFGHGKVQQTPMAQGGDQGTYYVLTLNDISVGSSRLNIQLGSAKPTDLGDGSSIIIDSGTTLTILPQNVCDSLEQKLASFIKYDRVDPPQGFNLCYSVNSSDLTGFPELTFHFDGADWLLPPSNAFVSVDEGVICLAIVHADIGLSIFGNVAQQNVHVEYDLGQGVLSFAPTDCTSA